MIDRRALYLLAAPVAFVCAVPASAQEGPPDDPRLVTITFDDSRVFTINGRVKVQTTIKFAPDEMIENVAIGDSDAWQVQPNKAQSILFVKPLQPTARTNMTVVTSRRTYLFDLVASMRNAPLYVMQFHYPELERAKAEALLAEAEAARLEREEASSVELAAANDPYAVADPASLNFNWTSDGRRAPAARADLRQRGRGVPDMGGGHADPLDPDHERRWRGRSGQLGPARRHAGARPRAAHDRAANGARSGGANQQCAGIAAQCRRSAGPGAGILSVRHLICRENIRCA